MQDGVEERGSGQRKRLRLIRNDGRYGAGDQLEPSGGNNDDLPNMSRLPCLHSLMVLLRPRALAAPPIQLDPCRPSSK